MTVDASPLWQPAPDAVEELALTRLAKSLATEASEPLLDYTSLHRHSVADPGRFWDRFWDFAGVIGEKGNGPALLDADQMPGAQFFPAARLNYAENILVRTDDATAIVFRGEDRVAKRWSWAQLNAESAAFQAAYAEASAGFGDRVAAIMPNMPEAIAGLAGAAASGLIWSSCSPDFGTQGVLDRFGQIEPTVLIACDGYFYGGKTISLKQRLQEVAAALPSVRRILIIPYIGEAEAIADSLPRAEVWRGAMAGGPARPHFVRVPFNHPLYILFSSGTTGVPKCIVHGHGGIILKHLSELTLHCDLKADDKLFYFTTCGWMMWNWLVSGLSQGATLLLYDGNPFHPTPTILFDYADAEGMTIFGTSAKYIDALKKSGARPRDTHRLTALRSMCSTGSPLVPEGFDYVYTAIKPDLHLASISGGTDICGCFVLGIPSLPVWRGEIQGPAMGLAMDVTDDEGRSVRGEKGELVCRKPFPSMPVMFWNDPDGSKYHSAYFERFPGLWHHGDFAEWTEHDGIIIHGRSDATLNPGGVRIGTAEIYRQVEKLPEIQESIVIAQEWQDDVRVVLFVVLRPGHDLDAALQDRIRRQVRDGASPRHVPAKIIAVADIPRTKSGKITELAVREIVHGRPVKNAEALANPTALELYRDLVELQN